MSRYILQITLLSFPNLPFFTCVFLLPYIADHSPGLGGSGVHTRGLCLSPAGQPQPSTICSAITCVVFALAASAPSSLFRQRWAHVIHFRSKTTDNMRNRQVKYSHATNIKVIAANLSVLLLACPAAMNASNDQECCCSLTS